jgi:hypothetical protein
VWLLDRRSNLHRAEVDEETAKPGFEASEMLVKRTYRSIKLPGLSVCALFAASAANAQALPSSQEFETQISECAVTQSIAIRQDLIGVIASIYSVQRPNGSESFRSAAGFLQLMPAEVRNEAYRMYVQCVAPVISSPAGLPIDRPEQTLTCYGEQNLSGDRRREEIVMPLNCPPEVERGYDFTISGSYVCGNIVRQEIIWNDRKRPTAVKFNSFNGCFREDNDTQSAKANCRRLDNPNYQASHSCFIVSFHSR